MQELRQTISCQGEAAEPYDLSAEAIRAKGEAKMAKKGKMRSASAVKRGGNLRRAPDAKARKGSRSCKADDLQEMITALRAQLNHVRDQTAFLALKRSEMRPDDQVSLYGFMDAQEQLKIEKSLLAGHAWMLRDMMTESKFKPDVETRRLLNEIRNAA
jgi:hypothetical protein